MFRVNGGVFNVILNHIFKMNWIGYTGKCMSVNMLLIMEFRKDLKYIY